MGIPKISKQIEMREADFYRLIKTFKKYPDEMLEAFYNYWSEKNKSGSKMRFELEKTWDTGRRLGTWDRNNFGNKNQPSKTAPVIHIMSKEPVKEAANDIERLDQLLDNYLKSHTPIPQEVLATYAKPITDNHLWPASITKEQMDKIKVQYNNDPIKVKSYFVERTLVHYITFGLTFAGAMAARK